MLKNRPEIIDGTFQKAIRGGKWLGFDALLQQALAFASFFVLARLLFPDDFGIIAILFLIIGTFDYLTSPSFEWALVQRQDDIKPYLNSIWTLNLIRSFVLFAIIFASAPFFAKFFHIENALLALRLSGFLLVIQYLGNIGQVYITKDIDFKKIFLRNVVGTFGYVTVAIVWAFVAPSFWALFAGQTILYIATAAATYWIHPYRPKLSFNFKILVGLVGYSKWIYGQNIVSKLSGILDSAVLGRFLGPTQVGIYTKALSFASIVPAAVNNIITKVSFSAYSLIQTKTDRVKEGFLKTLDIAISVSAGFLMLFIVGGENLIRILFSDRWIAMAGPLQILAGAVTLGGIILICYPIFNALGHPHVQFKLDSLKLIIFTILLLILVPRYGAIGAAWTMLISSASMLLFVLRGLQRTLFINARELTISPLITFSCALISGIVTFFLLSTTFADVTGLFFLMILTAMMFFYLLLLFLAGILWNKGPYSTVKLLLRELIR